MEIESMCIKSYENISKNIICTVVCARTNVIGSRTSFFIASVRSSAYLNICI